MSKSTFYYIIKAKQRTDKYAVEKEYIEDYNLLNDEYILSVFINNGKFLIK